MRKERSKSNDIQIAKERLESALGGYSRCLLEVRLEEEEIPITDSALQNASELYAEKLISTVEISAHNLIEADMDNLRAILGRHSDT